MSGLLVLVSALGLEALPTAVARSRVRLAPSGLARTVAVTSLAGLLLVEVVAIVCAWPIVRSLTGGEAGPHMFPGGPVAGVASAVVAVVLPVHVVRVAVRVSRQRRRLRPEAWFGTHVSLGEMELVVVPTEEMVAFAVPGAIPQVVISRGAFDVLDSDQLLSVIRHERAHLTHHHTLYLTLASILAPLTRIPVVGDSIHHLPGWLERWADDESAVTPVERRRVQDVLLSLAATDHGAAATSMTPAGTVSDRLAALEEEPARSSRRATALVFVSILLIAAVGLAPLVVRLL